MKGIILAGGKGTRLTPATRACPKSLMTLFDKPMIYYPLSTLMLAKIKDVLVITCPEYQENFKRTLGDGSDLGMNISYANQEEPRGLPDAYIIGADYIEDDNSCLILGDNIIYGHGLPEMLKDAGAKKDGATIFGYHVGREDAKRSGVVEFDKETKKVISIEEKPEEPKSKYVSIGLYFCDNDAVEIARSLKPSKRGELEITDISREYLKRGKLEITLLGRGFTWLDTGTPNSLTVATNLMSIIQQVQGLKIGCIEEVAYNNGWIDKEQMKRLAQPLLKSGYGEYLLEIIEED
jgi:glucose-1-phosphate thymidylyltransferase